MAIRVNPKLIDELESYGAEDVSKCYHCGNCSAVCPLSKDPFIFPRQSMRYLQMGLETKLESNLEPWLCYYCGECSDALPARRRAGRDHDEPAPLAHRPLRLHRHLAALLPLLEGRARGAILLVAFLTGAGFLAFGFAQGDINVYGGPNAFLPERRSDPCLRLAHGRLSPGLAAAINCARMWWFTIGRDKTCTFALQATTSRRLYLLPLHFLTQKRYSQCDKKRPWVLHLVLMLSYVTMLILIMFFLRVMQAGPEIDWTCHVFGLPRHASAFSATTVLALRGRIKKTEPHYKHSHESDWMFLICSCSSPATGILQFTSCTAAALDAAANIVYVIHLMAVVPMLVLEVPFSKWAHLAYRPLAMYFAAVARGEHDRAGAQEPALAASGPLTEPVA